MCKSDLLIYKIRSIFSDLVEGHFHTYSVKYNTMRRPSCEICPLYMKLNITLTRQNFHLFADSQKNIKEIAFLQNLSQHIQIITRNKTSIYGKKLFKRNEG